MYELAFHTCFGSAEFLHIYATLFIDASLHLPTTLHASASPTAFLVSFCARRPAGVPDCRILSASVGPPAVNHAIPPPSPGAGIVPLVADCLTQLSGGLIITPATISSPVAIPALQPLVSTPDAHPATHRPGSTRSAFSRPAPLTLRCARRLRAPPSPPPRPRLTFSTKTDDDTERQLVHTLAHAIVFIVSIRCFSNSGAACICPFLLERRGSPKPGRPKLLRLTCMLINFAFRNSLNDSPSSLGRARRRVPI